MTTTRRQKIKRAFSSISEDEKREIKTSTSKWESRRAKKEVLHESLKKSSHSYKTLHFIQKYVDGWHIDAIIGFAFPGIGDILGILFAIPSVYISSLKIKSFPLTLAIIYNSLADCVIGMLPFYIGDIFDIFIKSNRKNFELIMGYIEDDKKIISEINRKAIFMGIMVVIMCALIYLMFLVVKWQLELLATFWQWFFGLF